METTDKKQCPKCGKKMEQNGPYLHVKEEGQVVCEPPSKAYYCMNPDCEDYEEGKYIED